MKNEIKNEETVLSGSVPEENAGKKKRSMDSIDPGADKKTGRKKNPAKKSARAKKEHSERDDVLEKMMARKTERTRKVKKSSAGKEITIAFLIVAAVVLAGTAATWFVNRKLAEPVSEAESENIPVLEPIITPEIVPAPEEKLPEKKVPAPVVIAELDMKVLNAGASAGLAGKVKTALVSQGYAKAEAGNTAGDNIVGNFIYYSSDNFKEEAGKIDEFLVTRNIKSEVLPAETDEQKSGSIVILIGK